MPHDRSGRSQHGVRRLPRERLDSHRGRWGSWERLALPESEVFSVAVSSADSAVYAGTEPSRLFRSRDGGASFEELQALPRIPSKPRWSFPPRPRTSLALDCARFARSAPPAGRDRARRPDVHRGRWSDVHRPPARCSARRARGGVAPGPTRPSLRGRWRRSRVEPGRWQELDGGRCRP